MQKVNMTCEKMNHIT